MRTGAGDLIQNSGAVRVCGRLKVLIALTNNWNYNDLQTDWKCSYTNWSSSASQCDDFFSDRGAIQMYKDHVRTFLGRVNSINGRTYSQDETIFGADPETPCICTSSTTYHQSTSACLAMMRAAHLCGDHWQVHGHPIHQIRLHLHPSSD